MNRPKLAVVLLLTFILFGCSRPIDMPNAISIPTAFPASPALATPILVPPTVSPAPTATEVQLPFIPGIPENREYCEFPKVALPFIEAEGLDEDEIAIKLMSLHLDYYNNSQTPGYCRIDGYQIEKVFEMSLEKFAIRRAEGDFLRVVSFSVKLIQLPNSWMSYSGEIDQGNWLHTAEILAIKKVEADGVYVMHFTGP